MTAPDAAWAKLHDAYLETHLERLRLLARQRVRWLRAVRWRTDPLDDGAGTPDARADRQLDPALPGQRAALPDADGEAAALRTAVATHEERLAEQEEELRALGGRSALSVLEHVAGLSAVERDAVVVALAPELDISFRNLYAYLHDDPSLRVATPGLVADLTGRSPSDAWELLHPAAPSRRFRVFGDGGSEAVGASQALRLDPRVVAFLRGDNAPDERLRRLIEVLPEVPVPPPHRELVERLTGWLADPERVAGHRVVNLLGAPGQGREAVAAAVARDLGLVPLRLHADRVPTQVGVDIGRLLDRETLLLPAALYADAPGETLDDPALAAAAESVLDDVGGLLFLGSRTRRLGRHPAVAVEVPPLAAGDRVRLWRTVLGAESPPDEQLSELVQQFPLGPEGIMRAASEARALAELDTGVTGAAPDRDGLWAACRTIVGHDLGELATRLGTDASGPGSPGRPQAAYGWGNLVLPDAQSTLLRDIAAQVAARPRVYEQWGFGRRLARGRGITALFTGPSGTGKTMAAEILAGHLALDLYRIDLSSVVSKYIGETEKNLRRVFDAAEGGGAILFFDEADALFGKRTEVTDSHDRHANVEVNYLLQRMEDYAGLAILATNRKADLDPAFVRRIRFVVAFPFPDRAHRRRIWETVWPADTPLGDLDPDALARLEIAGGNIRTISVNAAFLAAARDEPVGMPHVLRAARHEYAKLDRRPTRAEFGDGYEAVQP